MNYIIAASTDIGIKKNTNQDSLSVRILDTPLGQMAFAIMCDGMGGLSSGEIASASLITAFLEWVDKELVYLCNSAIDYEELKREWQALAIKMNEKIMNYGKSRGCSMGTTLTAMLITEENYYVINVGDTRAYEISDNIVQITEDQTFINREIKLGNMTPEQARVDPRRNMLLQCIGASNVVVPDFFIGKTKKDAVYMLCCDGFRHEITPEELFTYLHPNVMLDANAMKANMDYLIELNKHRMETDNISVLAVRTF